MRWWLAVIGIAFFVSPGLCANPTGAHAKRIAFVVGNSSYTNLGRLPNPILDAASIANILAENYFDVISCDGKNRGCFDLTEPEFLKALKQFERESKGAELSLFFYAGHGMEAAGINVVAAVDSAVDCAHRGLVGGIPIDAVLSALSGANRKIVVLDACRNDPFGSACPGSKEAGRPSFKDFKAEKLDRFVLFSSTKPGQVALDGLAGEHSPFARELLASLKKSPGVYFHQVFDQVAKDVIVATGKAGFTQIPEALIRGGAPEDCLAGADCVSEHGFAALKDELEGLKVARVRDQELAAIAKGYLDAIGADGLNRPLTDEETRRIVEGVKVASQAVAEMGGSRGDEALRMLKAGKADAAEKLLAEALERQEKTANAAEKRAVAERKEAAMSAAHLAALNRPKDIVKSAEYLRKSVTLDPSNAQSWIDLGEVAREMGSLDEAKRSFERAIHSAKAANDPISLTRATYRLGEIAIDQGDVQAAQTSSIKALALADVPAPPGVEDSAWQRELSVTLEKVGDTLLARGDLGGATVAFKRSLEIRIRLANIDPNNGDWQRAVAVAYNKIGNVNAIQAVWKDAKQAYGAGMQVSARLARSDSSNFDRQRDLSIMNENIGNVLLEERRLPEALEQFQSSLAIRVRLVGSNPRNAMWQRDISVAREKIGDVFVAQGRLGEGLKAYSESFDIRDRLTKVNPKVASWQRDLSVSYNKLGDVLQAQGNLSASLDNYKSALRIRRDLVKINPRNVGTRVDLALQYARLGQIYSRKNEKGEALLYFIKCRKMLSPIAVESDNQRWRDYLENLDADIAALRH